MGQLLELRTSVGGGSRLILLRSRDHGADLEWDVGGLLGGMPMGLDRGIGVVGFHLRDSHAVTRRLQTSYPPNKEVKR